MASPSPLARYDRPSPTASWIFQFRQTLSICCGLADVELTLAALVFGNIRNTIYSASLLEPQGHLLSVLTFAEKY